MTEEEIRQALKRDREERVALVDIFRKEFGMNIKVHIAEPEIRGYDTKNSAKIFRLREGEI